MQSWWPVCLGPCYCWVGWFGCAGGIETPGPFFTLVMNPKRTWQLVLLALGLLAFIVLFERPNAPPSKAANVPELVFSNWTSDQVISVEVVVPTNQYLRVEKANGAKDRRFRIEHAQHLRASDLPRFARLGVIASMQPYHAIDDGRWAEPRIGRERCRTTYAFRSLLDAKAVLAFGSDWDVAPLSPLAGIFAAVTRRTTDGRNPAGWSPEQKITVEEALRAYTSSAAYAAFEEGEKGTLSPGKLADFVVLSADLLGVKPEEIERIAVNTTVVGGRVVFSR